MLGAQSPGKYCKCIFHSIIACCLTSFLIFLFLLYRNDKEDEFWDSNKAEIPGSPLTVSYFYLSVPCVLSYTICEK